MNILVHFTLSVRDSEQSDDDSILVFRFKILDKILPTNSKSTSSLYFNWIQRNIRVFFPLFSK